jgi:hypothetical protein
MNPVTFNEPFEALLKTPGLEWSHGAALSEAIKSPLLMWHDDQKEDVPQSIITSVARDEWGFAKSLFPCFRAGVLMGAAGDDQIRIRMVAWSKAGELAIYVKLDQWISDDWNKTPDSRYALRWMRDEVIMLGGVDDAGVRRGCILLRKTGERVLDRPDWAMKVNMNLTIGFYSRLALAFANPHFHVCSKSPPAGKVPRSVEWRKARQHYVLLHKSHEANRKESVGKRVIAGGENPVRAAHSRRAHYRVLRSPKFKHKHGQRVWVASAWVGPREWTDHSGQIYKIVDR